MGVLKDQIMGRKRKNQVRIHKKRLPKLFPCPKCGKESIKVTLSKEENYATVGCGNCGINNVFQIKPFHQEVDVYCMFTDKLYTLGNNNPTSSSPKGLM